LLKQTECASWVNHASATPNFWKAQNIPWCCLPPEHTFVEVCRLAPVKALLAAAPLAEALPVRPCPKGLDWEALPVKPCPKGLDWEALPVRPCPKGLDWEALPVRPCPKGLDWEALPV